MGKTERHLRARIYEHMRDINKKNENNALFRHTLKCKNANIKFWVLEEVKPGERGGDWETFLEYRELIWQIRLDACSHVGMNDHISIKPVLKLLALNPK